ncbi:hypothetical protein TPADAL_0993a [Treponema pallidum subsp. pallidum DAL-1]|nr:hypothetical protein TPADAL_0993a [Treponema pallidum subsp. pallidum DAL-1]
MRNGLRRRPDPYREVQTRRKRAPRAGLQEQSLSFLIIPCARTDLHEKREACKVQLSEEGLRILTLLYKQRKVAVRITVYVDLPATYPLQWQHGRTTLE